MEMPRILEILDNIILLLSKKRPKFTGICSVIYYMQGNKVITFDEAKSMVKILQNHKPTSTNYYAQFTKNKYWVENSDAYWWQPMNRNVFYIFFTIFNIKFHIKDYFKLNESKIKEIRINYLKKIVENMKTH